MMLRRSLFCLFCLVWLAVLAHCSQVSIAIGGACSEDADCISLRCQGGVCVAQEAGGSSELVGDASPDTTSEPPVLDDAQEPASPVDAGPSKELPAPPEQPASGGDVVRDGAQVSLYDACDGTTRCPAGAACTLGVCLPACDIYLDPPNCPDNTACALGGCWRKCSEGQSCPGQLRCVAGFCVGGYTGLYCHGKGDTTLPSKNVPLDGQVTEGKQCIPLRDVPTTSPTFLCDAKSNLFCARQGRGLGLGTCQRACDPLKGLTGNPGCAANEDCEPEPIADCQSFLGGRCIPSAPRKGLDEVCEPKKIRCQEGLVCKYHTHAKSYQCTTTCDPSQGSSGNPACPRNKRCEKDSTRELGTCVLLATAPKGAKQAGEACTANGGPDDCDGTKGLFCTFSRTCVDSSGGECKEPYTCAASCYTRDGRENNPRCAAGFLCLDAFGIPSVAGNAPFGGICLPKGTQKEGERCDTRAKRCLDGLTCQDARCQTSCTRDAECPTNQICDGRRRTCALPCDMNKGTPINPACALGSYCEEGVCRLSWVFVKGTKKLGEKCGGGVSCDGSANLFCQNGTCQTSCNPRKGLTSNPLCRSGQECRVLDPRIAPYQGTCVSPGSKKRGEFCSRGECAAGLLCTTLRCSGRCQPSGGVYGNSSCQSDEYCHPQSHLCLQLPKPGSTFSNNKEGGSCSGFSECAFNFTCGQFQKVCFKACRPEDGATGNQACRQGEECVGYTNSHLGGRCLPLPAGGLGDFCDREKKRCKQGLVCVRNSCKQACDDSKAPPNAGCAGLPGTFCLKARVSDYGSSTATFCVTPCDTKKGIFGNKSCPLGSHCGKGVYEVNRVTKELSFCMPHWQYEQVGQQSEGQGCDPYDPRRACNDLQGLVCEPNKGCKRACNPRNGHSDCQSGEICRGTEHHAKGGYCTKRPE